MIRLLLAVLLLAYAGPAATREAQPKRIALSFDDVPRAPRRLLHARRAHASG